jgi:hypothetical protein
MQEREGIPSSDSQGRRGRQPRHPAPRCRYRDLACSRGSTSWVRTAPGPHRTPSRFPSVTKAYVPTSTAPASKRPESESDRSTPRRPVGCIHAAGAQLCGEAMEAIEIRTQLGPLACKPSRDALKRRCLARLTRQPKVEARRGSHWARGGDPPDIGIGFRFSNSRRSWSSHLDNHRAADGRCPVSPRRSMPSGVRRKECDVCLVGPGGPIGASFLQRQH